MNPVCSVGFPNLSSVDILSWRPLCVERLYCTFGIVGCLAEALVTIRWILLRPSELPHILKTQMPVVIIIWPGGCGGMEEASGRSSRYSRPALEEELRLVACHSRLRKDGGEKSEIES